MLDRHEAELPEFRDRLSDCETHLANLTGQAHGAFSGLAELRAMIDVDRVRLSGLDSRLCEACNKFDSIVHNVCRIWYILYNERPIMHSQPKCCHN